MLEKKWVKCLLETFELEEEFTGDEQRNVAEGQEVWEAGTFIVTTRATCGATLMVVAEATLTTSISMGALKPL